MVVGPLNSNSLRADLFASHRQTQAAGPQAAGPEAPGGTAALGIGRRANLQLQELMQTGRENSALLSALPGPNLSFFQAPGPAEAGFLQGAAGVGAPGGRPLNVPLLETEQTGRVTSSLFSALMGSDMRVFPAPTPPVFTEAANAAGSAATPEALPPAGVQLLETEQAGRTTSTLLSGLMAPGQPPGGFIGASPSAQDMRIASDAYRMETQAQLDYERRVAGGPETREWFA
jgi:hypothetical protein